MSRFPRPDWRVLEPYAPDRRPAPVDLSDNTNLWGVHPTALEAVRNAAPDDLLRYPSVYADRLRAAGAEAWGVPVECIATGCGSDDLIDSAFRAASAAGGRAVYAVPTFSMVETFARMNGLEPSPLSRKGVLERAETLLEGDPAVIYLCSPENPTGETLEREWVESLLERTKRMGPDGPLLVVDEAYADYGGYSLLRLAPRHPRLVVLRTLSKAYGLAGLRVGLAVGATAIVAEIEKSRGPYKVGRVAEAAAISALEDGEGWVAEVVSATRRERGRLQEALEARGLRPLPSEANFVLVPVDDAAGTAGRLRERGVAVRPFPALPDVGDAIRVTVGPSPLMERFLEALDQTRGRERRTAPDAPASPAGRRSAPPRPPRGAPARSPAIRDRDRSSRSRTPPRGVDLRLLDYGSGNIHSLAKALERAGARVRVVREWREGLSGEALVLPGVGAFGVAARSLGSEAERVREALVEGLPCLGICLGMQLLFRDSEEAGGHGIARIEGRVRKLAGPRVPQMGWNDVEAEPDSPLFGGIGRMTAYFAHSFSCEPEDEQVAVAWSEYGDGEIVAAVRQGRTFGVQFHPEKSSAPGLRLLENFLALARGEDPADTTGGTT